MATKSLPMCRFFLLNCGSESLYNRIIEAPIHRVDRVPTFLSSRPNWDPHPLTPRRVCTPPPLVPGGSTLACGRGGGGVDTLGTVYMYFVVQSHYAKEIFWRIQSSAKRWTRKLTQVKKYKILIQNKRNRKERKQLYEIFHKK